MQWHVILDILHYIMYRDGFAAHRRSPIQVLTGPDVEELLSHDTYQPQYATF